MTAPASGQARARSGERERAVVAALRLPAQRRFEVEESLDELAGLVEAAGGTVVERVVQERPKPTPGHHFGRGKIEEIAERVRAARAGLLVCDDALSPVQERNISRALGIKVIDRTALILDIFAQRARTSEGKLQVELAQLTYLLPRLVGQWSHLERLGGGIGTRGPGETQLESDRRVIRRRVMQIRGELDAVRVQRRVQREARRRSSTPVVALVGYTNAGKTTLLNSLSGAGLRAADQLFVTLDPAARRVDGTDRHPFVLTDTVGFIRKLPHQLVAAFRATLEELTEADLLLHIVDASHPGMETHMDAVREVLRTLEVEDRPTILVLNKVDRVEERRALDAVLDAGPAVAVSARTGEGLAGLLAAIDGELRRLRGRATLCIPHREGAAVALCYERGRVLAREDRADCVRLDVELPGALLGTLAAYRV